MATKDDNSHILALQQLCRVCGDKVKPAKKRHTVYSCKNHPIDLLNTFDIDVQQDQVSIHSQYFCQACKGAIYHHKTNGVVLRSVTTWKHHDKDACETCGRGDRAKMGGRHSKIHIGRPAVMSKRSFLSHVLHVAPPSHLCKNPTN